MAEKKKRPVRGDYRSGFEHRIALSLYERGVDFEYETEKWEYVKDDLFKAVCEECGSNNCVSRRTYTPDFILPNGVIIEAKGKATPPVRTALVQIKKSNPDKDLRLVFMADNWLTSRHKRRYSDWARENGFEYAIGGVPDEWLH